MTTLEDGRRLAHETRRVKDTPITYESLIPGNQILIDAESASIKKGVAQKRSNVLFLVTDVDTSGKRPTVTVEYQGTENPEDTFLFFKLDHKHIPTSIEPGTEFILGVSGDLVELTELRELHNGILTPFSKLDQGFELWEKGTSEPTMLAVHKVLNIEVR